MPAGASHASRHHGSTLPLLPVCEEVIQKNAGKLTRRDASTSAVRVQLASGARLVGVRFPRQLLGELRSEPLAWHTARNAAHRRRRASVGHPDASVGGGHAPRR